MELNLIDNIVFDGVNNSDYPDYSDAYILSADYNGVEMTEEKIELIPGDFVYGKLMEQLFNI